MKLGILLSGRGSNMKALVHAARDGRLGGEVALVLSNRADAAGLAWAESEQLPTSCIPHRDHPDRDSHDALVLRELEDHGIELVCLAGYMRLLGKSFVSAFANRILNIHPSLLPAFPGLDAQRQAFEHGVRVTGATVHFVNDQLDHGPILLQEPVAVQPGDSVDSLSDRILEVEHRLYPRAVSLVTAGRVEVEGRRVRLRDQRS